MAPPIFNVTLVNLDADARTAVPDQGRLSLGKLTTDQLIALLEAFRELDPLQNLEAEPEILAHMNQDHAETCRLYATRLLGAAEGDWHCAGCDPEGMELQLKQTALWLQFPQRVDTPGGLRVMLKQLADQARAA